ncbi:MAG: hypothetical protein Q4C96_09700 [Planctomycetia bacterium]|nr:hypothetical protein [Planctomycetia bacterium]
MYDQYQLREIVKEDPRFKVEAYYYVLETLDFARSRLHMGKVAKSERFPQNSETDADDPEEVSSHITGQELCEALRIRSVWMFGYMAKTVLNQWGVFTTDDFGTIVYNMVKHNKIRVTAEDSPDDFREVYDFQEVFCSNFCIDDDEICADMF